MLNSPIILQAENAVLFDSNPSGNFNDSRKRRVRDLRPGYSGTGYTDFGGAGDSLTFTFESGSGAFVRRRCSRAGR